MGPRRVATPSTAPPRGVLWSCGRVPYGDRREPCGPGGQPVDNAHALPTACPHSRASRPQPPQDQQPSRFNKTPSHLTSPTPTHHHLPLIHNAFELAPPPPDAPHRSGSSLDWITLNPRGQWPGRANGMLPSRRSSREGSVPCRRSGCSSRTVARRPRRPPRSLPRIPPRCPRLRTDRRDSRGDPALE